MDANLTATEQELLDALRRYETAFQEASQRSMELRRVSYFLSGILGSDADGKSAMEKLIMLYEKYVMTHPDSTKHHIDLDLSRL